jgi:NAD(P)-dependent dehydrogenase (short-subunit alcohol dehydrogenase family)
MTPMMEKALAEYGKGDAKTFYKNLLEEYPQGAHARFTTPEEVAESIYFLSKPEVEAITGACLSIDFGLTAGY